LVKQLKETMSPNILFCENNLKKLCHQNKIDLLLYKNYYIKQKLKMGASSSIIIKIDIYISFCEKTENIVEYENKLKTYHNYILDSSLLINEIKEKFDSTKLDNIINYIISQTKFVIICVTKDIYKSFNQSLEMNSLISNNYNINKIIYLMFDIDFTPDNSYIKHVVNKNWFPYYDEITREDSFSKILTILSQND